MGGRTWCVVCTPEPGFAAAHQTKQPWVLLAAALAATRVLTLYLTLIGHSVATARRVAAEQAAARESLESEVAHRKRTERALLESQHRLSEAQRIGGIGNWDWNIGADTVFLSEQGRAIFGLESPESEVPYSTFMATVHPADKNMADRLSSCRYAITSICRRVNQPARASTTICHGWRIAVTVRSYRGDGGPQPHADSYPVAPTGPVPAPASY